MLLSNVDRPNWTSVSSIAMSRSDLKLKLQNQISRFTTIKTYLEKKDTTGILFLVSMYLLLEIGPPSLYKVI